MNTIILAMEVINILLYNIKNLKKYSNQSVVNHMLLLLLSMMIPLIAICLQRVKPIILALLILQPIMTISDMQTLVQMNTYMIIDKGLRFLN